MASGYNSPEDQLRELFSSCDKGECGLTAAGLRQLCCKLRLGEKGEKQLKQSLGHQRNNDAATDEDLIALTFEEFKEAFVHLLSQQDTAVSVPSIRAHEDKLDFVVSGGIAAFSGPSSMENKKYSSNASAVNKSNKNCDDSQRKTSSSESDKGLNNLHYSGDNEEEYLRSTWQRLGVGHDGYLTMEELATVCLATGMDKVANEVLEQLFSRLDVDGDGRISFEEFVHMFQNGGPTGNNSLTLDESLSLTQDLSGSPLAIGGLKNGEESQCSTTESGFFSTIDEDKTGYASVSRVIGLWESINISAGAEILRDMGFPSRPRDRLCLQELAQALEEECRLPEDPSIVTPLQTAVMTCLHEAKFLRTSLEAARGERDKLRTDLSEANHRLSLLAQDLDDHNAHMEANAHQQIQDLERHYREQVRELQEAVLRERDSAREQISVATREISTHNSQLQQEETRLKQAITQLQNDVKRLEGENLEMSEKLQEAEKMLQLMEKQSQEMQQLKEKISEMESCSPREEEYRGLLERLEGLTSENHQLRDNNDELLAQLDAAPHLRGNQSAVGPTNSELGEPSLDGSCLGDYIDPPMGLMAAVKRRGSTSAGSGDDSTEEDSPRGGKVRRCSKGANVHYVDVGSYDESFFDSSMTSLVKGGMTIVGGGTEESSSLDNVMGPQINNQTQNQVFASVRANMGSESPRSLDYVAHAKGSSRATSKALKMQNKDDCSLSSEHAQDTSSFQASTPVKKMTKSPMKEKCGRCYETEGRLTMALEELEMAMRREEQERTQRITITNILSNKDEESSCSNNSVEPDTTTTTTYPNSEISRPLSIKYNNNKDREVVLEGQCRRLESELAKVRIEVLKLVEEKEKLLLHKQQLQKRHLGEESITLKERCKAMSEKIKKKNKALTSLVKHSPWQQQQEIDSNIDSKSYQEDDLLNAGVADVANPLSKLDSITEEETEEEESKDEFNSLEKQVSFMEKLLNTVADTAEKQKASLEEKCQKLEHSLEILRVEFDKSEDYWTLKLSEEQDYYEEERRLTDDKFSALERKIREYEELVLQGSSSTGNREDRSEDEDRLSTIDESAMWEKQVTELEEEVQMLQRQMKDIKDESRGVESAWERRLVEERRTSSQERSNLQEQLNQANNQVAAVVEELEKVRQDTEQHNNNRVNNSNHNSRAQVSVSSVEGGLVNGFMSSDGDSLSPGPMEQDTHQSGEETILSSFRNQLRQCQSRVHYLETALRQHHAHAHHILTVTREQHAAEVQNLEGMMAATQQMLGQHIAKYKDQLSKASRSDSLVRELYLENAQLMRALQITESRQKSAEENTRRIQMAHLGHSTIS